MGNNKKQHAAEDYFELFAQRLTNQQVANKLGVHRSVACRMRAKYEVRQQELIKEATGDTVILGKSEAIEKLSSDNIEQVVMSIEGKKLKNIALLQDELYKAILGKNFKLVSQLTRDIDKLGVPLEFLPNLKGI